MLPRAILRSVPGARAAAGAGLVQEGLALARLVVDHHDGVPLSNLDLDGFLSIRRFDATPCLSLSECGP